MREGMGMFLFMIGYATMCSAIHLMTWCCTPCYYWCRVYCFSALLLYFVVLLLPLLIFKHLFLKRWTNCLAITTPWLTECEMVLGHLLSQFLFNIGFNQMFNCIKLILSQTHVVMLFYCYLLVVQTVRHTDHTNVMLVQRNVRIKCRLANWKVIGMQS